MTVVLEKVAEGACLTIVDEGMGFDLEALRQLKGQPGWGLITMGERAKVLGGKFWVESVPGRGTSIIVEVPRI